VTRQRLHSLRAAPAGPASLGQELLDALDDGVAVAGLEQADGIVRA
jgi:hypothetical protein